MGGQMLGQSYVVNGEALLWAIGGAESSFGRNNVPRHEAAYCRRGRYFDPKLDRKFGCHAHCSYGPWQLMYANVVTIKPIDPELMLDPLHALPITVEWLRRVIKRGAVTVRDIADAWNSGSHRDSIVPVRYINRVTALYNQRIA